MKPRNILLVGPPEYVGMAEGSGYGTRASAIVRRPRGRRRYMVKSWSKYIGELRSEVVATAIGKVFGFPVQEVEPCFIENKVFRDELRLPDDKRAVLIKIDVRKQRDKKNSKNDIEDMKLGTDLLNEVIPGFAEKNPMERRKFITIESVEASLNKFEERYPEAKNKIKHQFFLMAIFDAIIGGTERHDQNWGVLISLPKNKFIRLTKFFDNGVSLLWNFEERESYYKDMLAVELLLSYLSY